VVFEQIPFTFDEPDNGDLPDESPPEPEWERIVVRHDPLARSRQPVIDIELPDTPITPEMMDIIIPTGGAGPILMQGDARHLPLPDDSVDLIVTSPPYWAQRSYQDGGEHYSGQIGAEATHGEYIDNLIECTRDWMRVLKPSGSMWVNLGDKYVVSVNGGGGRASSTLMGGPIIRVESQALNMHYAVEFGNVPRKSLVGLPWRYALRCIDELGLILRAEVIWNKANGIPESVVDRVRRSHETWFHLVKSPRYFSAVDHIRTDYAPATAKRYTSGYGPSLRGLAGAVSSASVRSTAAGDGGPAGVNPLGRLPDSVWNIPTQPLTVPPHLGVDHFAAFPMEWPRRIIQGWSPTGVCTACGEGRRPYMLKAPHKNSEPTSHSQPQAEERGWVGGHSSGIGKPVRARTVVGEVCACTPYTDHPGTHVGAAAARTAPVLVPGNVPRSLGAPALGPWREYHCDGWLAPPTRPAIVLDPFGGTGTTALVADVLGRCGIHVDMSHDYLRIAQWRTTDPGQRAAAMCVDKPKVELAGQLDLFEETERVDRRGRT